MKKLGLVVYGSRFNGKLKGISIKNYTKHEQQRKVYGQTTVNLDLPFFSSGHSFYGGGAHIKNRFFEIPATGNFLLTLRCPEFLLTYDESMVGYYDDNIESLNQEVDRYLKDNKLRKQKTVKAYNYVWEEHQFKHRFKKMFNILMEEL